MLAGRVSAASCPGGVSADTARQVSARVETLRPGAGYRFEGVRAKDDLVVLWSLNGKPCPPIRADFARCPSPAAAAALQVHWSTELFADCPGLRSVADEIAGLFGTALVVEPPPPSLASSVPLLIIALAGAAALLIHLTALGTASTRARSASRTRRVASAVLLFVAGGAAAEIGYRGIVWSTSGEDAARDDVFMLYAVGESTLVGEPFSEQFSLPRLVSEMLGGHVRGRAIEIVSVAQRGAGAHPQSLRFAGAVAYRNRTVPGAVLIYSGHNEPYLKEADGGARTPLLERALELRLGPAGRLAEQSWLLRDSLLYLRSLRLFRPHAGMHPYERSLRRIILTARDSGLIPILFTLPSNISAVEPNAYEQETHGIAAILRKGNALEQAGDVGAALEYYREQQRALGTDHPSSAALLRYRMARCEAALGRYDEARQSFWAVVDQDPRQNFGRATMAQNALIGRLAAEYAVPLVDAVEAFEQAAAHGIPGNDLFADGQHPNLRGYWLLASTCAMRLAAVTGAELSGSLPNADAIAAKFGIGTAELGRAHISAGSWLIATAAHHPWPVDRLTLAEQHFRAAADAGDQLSAWLGVALSQAARHGGFLLSSENLDLLARSSVYYTNRFHIDPSERENLLARLRRAGAEDAVVRKLEDLWS